MKQEEKPKEQDKESEILSEIRSVKDHIVTLQGTVAFQTELIVSVPWNLLLNFPDEIDDLGSIHGWIHTKPTGKEEVKHA